MREPRAAATGTTANDPGRFLSGSILRHVVVMSATGSIGLMAIFVVDLLSLLYVSQLGDPKLTAAVGFATIVQFFGIAITIGLMIAAGALVSRAIGRGDGARARRLAASATIHGILAAALFVAVTLPLMRPALTFIGADADTLPVAERFLWIVLPSTLLMAPGMMFSGLLRAVGAARQAMYVTLGGGIVTAIVDPILIFGCGLGVDGAAIATCIARATFALIGFWGVRRNDLVARPTLADVVADAPEMMRIALPAVLANLAPSVASAFIAHAVAQFGALAVAGNVVVDRLTPVAFGGLFAMSGSVGPILGQNWGAGRFDRMREVLASGALVTAVYTGVVWALLVVLREPLRALFELQGVAAELFLFFCLVSGPVWFFVGLLFLSNAAFNNLGFPFLSTALNWGRSTLGTMPPALLGGAMYGPAGVIAGVGIGSVAFGIAAVALAWRTIGTLQARARAAVPPPEPPACEPVRVEEMVRG
ncbi:MATE family efflux transporter [Methylobacterium sp. Leaf399]|uniref:MATE family efflux transporter n=1 Tax=unclassified Methylobacterium TaxID=2615210 RepID=UPI0006F25812|nr:MULTISPECIES: MATE family efflux transporter [unclassified Methylobacterium]KQP61550.1 MATE family efflux transporter [Methylobacterium sp. Leaf108]KQT19702.1 MATE family efflux transporter [Methylobacterium sp. Leaf399]KQT80752.1 MATE family efflux transporter [Methylobacterium sp. Leaf466]